MHAPSGQGPEPHRDAGLILELACAAKDRGSFQRQVLGVLDDAIGFTGAFFMGYGPTAGVGAPASPDLVTAGVGSGYAAKMACRSPCYEREIAPLKDYALAHGGVAVDTQVLGAAATRTCYYDELVRPAGGGHSLLCYLDLRGAPRGLLMLGRESRNPFRRRDLDRLRAMRGALALAISSFAQSSIAEGLALTTREREIGDLLLLGHTNRDIALALGTSPNTVRNQLAALFRKAEVSTRAELVGRLLGR
jgi:DNA-binding CsgD family transcriptional regulator